MHSRTTRHLFEIGNSIGDRIANNVNRLTPVSLLRGIML
jgi:hypothetical protein